MRVSGSFSGSWRRATAGTPARSASTTATAAGSSARIAFKADKELFPVLDLELRLLAALPVVDLQLEILGSDALLESDRRPALVVALARTLPAEERHQLVLTDFQVAEVETVHATLEEGIDLARRIKIVDDF